MAVLSPAVNLRGAQLHGNVWVASCRGRALERGCPCGGHCAGGDDDDDDDLLYQ